MADSENVVACPLSFEDLKDATLNSALLDCNAKCRECGKLAAKHIKVQGKIAALEAEIEAIKSANPNWASNVGDKAAIAACRTQLAGLEARLPTGKPPPSALFLLISPPL